MKTLNNRYMKRIYLLFVAAVATLSSVCAQQTVIADKVVAVVTDPKGRAMEAIDNVRV